MARSGAGHGAERWRAAEDRRRSPPELAARGSAGLPAAEERAALEFRTARRRARSHPDRSGDAHPREGTRSVRTLALVLLLAAPAVFADIDVAFAPHPGAIVPGDAAFREGRLGVYSGGGPLALGPGYLRWGNVCGAEPRRPARGVLGTGRSPGGGHRAPFSTGRPPGED